MGEQGGSEFGPAVPSPSAAAPFSVSGPSAATLDAARHGVTSFVVANTAGRPVTARLLVQPVNGADAAWFTLDGPIDRPMAVAATLSTEVRIDVPPKVPAGEHGLRLDVALEDAPDQLVAGPTAVFTVPEVKKRKFPWWILAVIVGALVVIGVGIWAILTFVVAPKPPESVSPPTISGTAQTGEELTVADGTWNPARVVILHVWQSCPADSDDPADCEDIVLSMGGDEGTASGETFVVGAEQEGLRIRVREVAVNADPDTFDGDLSALADLPQTTAFSEPTEVIQPPPVTTVAVPNVEGLAVSQAQSVLAASGLQALATFTGAGGDCDPIVTDQNPNEGAVVDIGSAVAISAPTPPPLFSCLRIIIQLPIDKGKVIDLGG
jgi:hypothetical protein